MTKINKDPDQPHKLIIYINTEIRPCNEENVSAVIQEKSNDCYFIDSNNLDEAKEILGNIKKDIKSWQQKK